MSYDTRAATDVDRSIGQRIRARRLEVGMSQEKLAELLDVTFQQIQKYEKGVNRIAASRLHRLASSLGTSVAAIVPMEADTEENEALLALGMSRDGAQLARAFTAIQSPRFRRLAVDAVLAIAELDIKGRTQ